MARSYSIAHILGFNMHTTRLAHLAMLRFTGRDAGRFLHNQLSADILALEPGGSTFACLCQPKGRVIALLLVWRRDDGYEVICPAAQQGSLATWLRRFIFRDDVQIQSSDNMVSGVYGAGPDGPFGARPIPGFCYDSGAPDDGRAEAAEAFRAHELEHGICWLDAATSEQFLPQMLGAGSIGALNFRKGCYPGQEIVARTYYLGKLKQQPLVLKFAGDTAPAVMDKLLLDPTPGAATSDEQLLEAVLVARALHADGCWRALSVARPGPQAAVDFPNGRLRRGEREWTISGHWLPVPRKGD